MGDMFHRLAPYIQDYIYASNWTELREIQVAACHAVFDTDENLLLSSGTASGKTEAAFLPVLTELYHHPSSSVGVLYISPLKALINDQFKRLDDLLAESNLPVCKWHGDASQAEKNRLLKHPEGILQITPESLESLLIHKRGACVKLFYDLRFVIIDEVHYFMRDVRGVQVLCLLERLQRLAGVVPRRIGLSATLGDLTVAQSWLNSGTGRSCAAPVCGAEKQKIRLLVQRFQRADQTTPDGALDAGEAAHYEYLYRMTLDRKTILFTNSREETELVMAHLRQLALKNKTPDVYRVHHGNISAVLREQAEDEMKSAQEKLVTGATVTLELGIDIGSLDQVVQVGTPATVSSFAQRLGRCGRRGQIPQILFTFMDDVHTTAADQLGPINWSFLRMIAIIELYTKQKWVEPLTPGRYPYSMLYHQTMSYLLSAGEATARELMGAVLRLSCFQEIPQEDYRILLRHLLLIGHLQKMESGGLIIGRAGEKVVSDYHFLAVFQVPEYYLVKDENRSIGAYLSDSCRERLEEIRYLARNSGILNHVVTQLSENKYAIFPWVGTRQLFTLHFMLLERGFKSKILWRTCVYLEVTFSGKVPNAKARIESALREIAVESDDLSGLPLPEKVQIEHKYNAYIPIELLRKEFIFDFLEPDGLRKELSQYFGVTPI